eukprot:770053-Alexandrium_andersonii.AAC.1
MSASLVGSEMCIRDRNLSVAAAGVRESRMFLGTATTSGNARGASQPVSYTHLTLPTICSV